jgi:hypothetical protein
LGQSAATTIHYSLFATHSLRIDLLAQHAGDVLDLARAADHARRDHDEQLEAPDLVGVLLEQIAEHRNLPQDRNPGLDLVGAILNQAAENGGAARLDDDVGGDIALRDDRGEIAFLGRCRCLAHFLIDVQENRIVGADARG